MKNEEEEVIKDFDDIFKYIGGWGPFQVRNLYAKTSQELRMLSRSLLLNVKSKSLSL